MHPDELLEKLKCNSNQRKRKNLDLIHAVCREQHERGSKDFSVATISKIACERGGPVKSTIHNKTGDDFKGLIKCWANFVGGVTRKAPKATENPIASILSKISDPAIRAVMGAVLAENKRLKGQLNLLRSQSNLVIDLRSNSNSHSGVDIQILPTTTLFSQSEKIALNHSISDQLIQGEGWKTDDYGRVLTSKGREIYKVGYISGIRKILEASNI